MGKGKKPKAKAKGSQSNPHRRVLKPSLKVLKPSKKPRTPLQPPIPTIPFTCTDRILLVGEGDFSFSYSLLTVHGCSSLIATSNDKQSVVRSKYSSSAAHVKKLEEEGSCKVVYSVDATRLGKAGTTDGGGKEIKQGDFNKIVFNFPHVGGLTKDMNRQVRHNQELLVGFFKSSLPLLAPEGKVIVTIFEGEPYDLWNIRDLARHSGLKVGRSFKFQACAYPGYKHVRTLGIIEGAGGWNGEDRPARSYMFEVNDSRAQEELTSKKKREASSSEDE